MRRLFALALTLAPAVLPASASALCAGDGVASLLAPDDLMELREVAANTPYGSGLYWAAQKDGTELAIMGTMHLPDTRHDTLLALAGPQLQTADLLLVEATLEDQTAMQVHMAQNPEMMTITSGPSLIDQIDAETWDMISDAAAARGVPEFMAAKMQPWFLSMTLAMPPCAMTSMMSGDVGLDGLLMEQAAAFNVPVAPLEPWQDMLALLASGTPEEQLEALRFGLMDADVQNALISTLMSTYFDGQTAFGWHVSRYLIDYMPGADPATFDALWAQLEDELLNTRNHNWIPVIDDAARTHDHIFIAFGAAHLIGDQGILQLLENDGWTITQR